jgi:class 3 adenylate cyclase
MRAVLFADLVGSSVLYHELGDREAHEIAARCLEDIIETVARFGGTVVKTIGDEVMATFPSAAAACSCAEEAVAAMRGRGAAGAQPLGVHVGFHYGPVLEENGDVFGDTVNVAAHMVQLAERQCILTTAATAELLEDRIRARMRQRERALVKGRPEPVEVFELTTGSETLIRFAEAPQAEAGAASEPALSISFGPQRYELRGRHRSVTIGRDESNDFVLSSPSASRFHARIEWRGRGYYLVDRSSNGTVIFSDCGRMRTLRREWLRINGSGSFGVGGSDQHPEERIRFECRGPAPDPNTTSRW